MDTTHTPINTISISFLNHPFYIVALSSKQSRTNWWFQPIGTICSSNWIISPGVGVKMTNVWVATTLYKGNPYNGYINPYYWVDDHPLIIYTYIYIHMETLANHHIIDYTFTSLQPSGSSVKSLPVRPRTGEFCQHPTAIFHHEGPW